MVPSKDFLPVVTDEEAIEWPGTDKKWTTDRYRTLSIADMWAKKVLPRWVTIKEAGNRHYNKGELGPAYAAYGDAWALTDPHIGLDHLFKKLSQHPEGSAAQRLVAQKDDIAPIIAKFFAGPVSTDGQPNKCSAICLANRAQANLKLGDPVAAAKDAQAAMMMDPSYVKGHYRYKSALEALGEKDKAARVDARIRQFTALSVNDGKEVVDPGFWLGFRLVLCFQKNYSEYKRVYEDPRAKHWRELACVQAERMSPFATMRVHMDVGCLDVRPKVATAEDEQFHFIRIGLSVINNRNRTSDIDHPAVNAPHMPSIDYRFVKMKGPAPHSKDPEALRANVGTPQSYAHTIAPILAGIIKDELPMLTSLSLSDSLSEYSDEVRSYLDRKGLLAPRMGRELDGLDVYYTAGSCIKHKKFGYRGVIMGNVDHTCNMSDEWIAQMGVEQLTRGRYQPWYHVLVDVRDRPGGQRCYVCHDNMELWVVGREEEVFATKDGTCLGPIDHPAVRSGIQNLSIPTIYRPEWDPRRGRYIKFVPPPGFQPERASAAQVAQVAAQVAQVAVS